jgi:hypothetical protein
VIHIPREPSPGILTPVLQDEIDGTREILLALFDGFTLAVGSRNLGTISDVPLPILLDDCGELVVKISLRHITILPQG